MGSGAWSPWQAAATYDVGGLTRSTTDTVQHRTRDAAGNIAVGVAVEKSTLAEAQWGSLWADTFSAPDGTALHGRAVEVAPTPTSYASVLGSTPLVQAGHLTSGTHKNIVAAGAFKGETTGVVIDTGVSNRVVIEATFTTGTTFPDGIHLYLYGTSATTVNYLLLGGTTYKKWISGTGAEVSLNSVYPGDGPWMGPRTMRLELRRSGTQATITSLAVDGVTKIENYALPELSVNGTFFGVGLSGPNTRAGKIDSWSVRAA